MQGSCLHTARGRRDQKHTRTCSHLSQLTTSPLTLYVRNAGLVPVVVENRLEGDELRADCADITEAIERVGAENVLCVITTTSCFAPRGADRYV